MDSSTVGIPNIVESNPGLRYEDRVTVKEVEFHNIV